MRRADTVALRTLALGLVLGLLSLGAWAQAAPVPTPQGPSLPLMVGQGAGANSYSVPIQTLLFFSALSFLPALLLLMTGFTRIVIVLSLLRQALGTQSAPPNQVIVGLSLFLTLFVMGPTLDRIYQEAYRPYTEQKMNSDSPTITWCGGVVCSPIAWRSSDSTMTIRVKLVISSSTAGRNDSAENTSSVCTGTE